jgi:hypothetical protein
VAVKKQISGSGMLNSSQRGLALGSIDSMRSPNGSQP